MRPRLWICWFTVLCLLAVPLVALGQDPPQRHQIDNFRLLYPAGWLLDVSPVQGVIYINDEAIEALDIIVIPPESVEFMVPEAQTPLALMRVFLAASADPMEELTIADREVLRVRQEERIIITTDLGEGNLVAMIVHLPADSFEEYEEQVAQIVSSMQLIPAPLALNTTYENLDMRLSFDYPQQWSLDHDPETNAVYVNSTSTAQDPDTRMPGDVSVMVVPAEQFASLGASAAEVAEDLQDIFSDLVISDVERVRVGQYRGYRLDLYNEDAEGLILVLEIGDKVMVFMAATIGGEFDLVEETILSIADTLQPYVGQAWLGG